MRKRKKASNNVNEDPIESRLKKVRRKKSVRSFLLRLGAVALAVWLVFGVLLGVAVVKGDSMSPALEGGDVFLFQRIGADYQTGDIVLVRTDGDTESVKRIVALPGQTVEIREATGEVLVDGEVLLEPYIFEDTYVKEGVDYPLTLGEDEYFVLGDSRENSRDSRNYGPVRSDQLDGKLLFLFFRWQG